MVTTSMCKDCHAVTSIKYCFQNMKVFVCFALICLLIFWWLCWELPLLRRSANYSDLPASHMVSSRGGGNALSPPGLRSMLSGKAWFLNPLFTGIADLCARFLQVCPCSPWIQSTWGKCVNLKMRLCLGSLVRNFPV